MALWRCLVITSISAIFGLSVLMFLRVPSHDDEVPMLTLHTAPLSQPPSVTPSPTPREIVATPSGSPEMISAELFDSRRVSISRLLQAEDKPKHSKQYNTITAQVALDHQSDQTILRKSVLSGNVRVLFLAGLEGSSHHLWRELLGTCELHGKCASDVQLSRLLWTELGGSRPRGKLGVFNYNAQKYKNWRYEIPNREWNATFSGRQIEFREALRKKIGELAKTDFAGIIYLNGPLRHKGPKKYVDNMMSYPNYGGDLKLFQTPDVRLLAEICEAEGVDFRVLFLHRNAAALLYSTAVNRNHGRWNEQAVILEHNAQVLLRQLQALDSEFVQCSDFHLLPRLPGGLRDFLGAASDEILPLMASTFKKKHGDPPLTPEQQLGESFLQDAVTALFNGAGCDRAKREIDSGNSF